MTSRIWRSLFLCASACWLGCGQRAAAQGTIVHTVLRNPNPGGIFHPGEFGVLVFTPSATPSVLPVDLNQDGIEDYRVVATGTTDGFQLEGSSLNAVWSRPTGGTDIGGFIVPLAPGTEIGPTLPPSDEWMLTQQGMFGVIAPGFSAYTSAGALGLFIDRTAYAGLQFDIGGNTHYGWIKVEEIPALAGGGVVYEYAYDIRPNSPILAGTVPEPSAWALLALAVAIGCFVRTRFYRVVQWR